MFIGAWSSLTGPWKGTSFKMGREKCKPCLVLVIRSSSREALVLLADLGWASK